MAGRGQLIPWSDVETPITEREIKPQPMDRLVKFVGTYRSGEGACVKLAYS